MKILQIGKYSAKFAGGIEKTTLLLSEYLAKKNNVDVITNSIDYKRKTYTNNKVLHQEFPAYNVLSTPITKDLIKFLKGKEYDIIQISHPNPAASLAYLIAKPKGKLLVWYHYDIFRQRFLKHFYNPFMNKLLKDADFIIATSENYVNTSKVLENYKSKTIVIPHGINFKDFNKKKFKVEAAKIKQRIRKPIILFVGRLIYYKGVDYLIRAMKDIDAKLIIIGQGPLEKELRLLVKELKIEQKVVFKKVSMEESLAKYYHACDIFVLPSIYRSEAFGMVLLEAMACGKPIITTEIGTGTSYICQNGVNGLIVPPKNHLALRNAIKHLLKDKELAKKYGEQGKKRAKNKFSINKMGKSFTKLYEELVI